MYAKHEGKHIVRAKCMQNNEESQAEKLAPRCGQLPHSHIGELKCMQNTKENIP